MTNFKMAAMAVAVAAAMTGTQALADGALAPGKPAGVEAAQHHGPSLLLIGGVTVALVAGIVIATSSGGSSGCSTTNCPNTPAASTSTTG